MANAIKKPIGTCEPFIAAIIASESIYINPSASGLTKYIIKYDIEFRLVNKSLIFYTFFVVDWQHVTGMS